MRRRLIPGLVAGAVLAGVGPMAAQANVDFGRGPGWMAGYVSNAPEQLLGVGVVLPGPGAWGVHANAKISAGSPARGGMFEPNMTPRDAEDLGDKLHNQKSAWTSVNLAAVRGFTSELALYLGGGVSSRTIYIQYVDELMDRGHFGRYWVEDEAQAGMFPNLIVGGFFRLGTRLVFQFGGETAPVGFTVGAHLLVR